MKKNVYVPYLYISIAREHPGHFQRHQKSRLGRQNMQMSQRLKVESVIVAVRSIFQKKNEMKLNFIQ